jgi:hypothetical protein
VATLEITRDFRWNTGTPTLLYYTVVGECTSSGCATTGIELGDAKCDTGTQQFLKIVAARNVAEVCQIISSQASDRFPIVWPIKSIRRHLRPVFSDDIVAGVDYSCQKLIEEDFQSIPECAEIALSFQAQVNIGATTYLLDYDFNGADVPGVEGAKITISGSSSVSITASELEYTASGGLTVLAAGEIGANLGLIAHGGGHAEITLFELEIDPVAEDLTPLVSTVGPTTKCGCEVFASISLRQNLATNNALKNFLSINKLTLPTEITLTFNNDAWRRNYHFTGLGETSQHERWNILYEWGCTTLVDGEDLSVNRWFFSLLATRKNLVTLDDFETRLLYYFSPTEACLDNALEFSFSIDTQSAGAIINGIQVSENIFYDGIGLFSSTYWVKNKLLRINVSESLAVKDNRFNISPIFPT